MTLFSPPKPSFLIIGAQKAATSSLYSYLVQHPNLLPAKEKELHFFNNDSHFQNGIDWYEQQFGGYNNFLKKHITFEATPNYIYFPYVAERIKNYNSKMKLVVILREPVGRAYSAYNMYKRMAANKYISDLWLKPYFKTIDNNLYKVLFSGKFPSIEEVIDLEMSYINEGSDFLEPSFLRQGYYAKHIKRFLKYFKKEQILILDYKDITLNTKDTLNQILNFIGIKAYNWGKLSKEIRNPGSYTSPMTPIVKSRLQEFYAPLNRELFELVGHTFDWNYDNNQ